MAKLKPLSTFRKERRGKRPTAPYKSWFEVDLAEELRQLKARAQYEPVKLPYTLECQYKPDWRLPNGIIIEGKGKLDYATRKKMQAIKRANPDLDIRLVFQRASNPIRKGSATTYGDWATEAGFIWADGHIPESWIKETRRKKR